MIHGCFNKATCFEMTRTLKDSYFMQFKCDNIKCGHNFESSLNNITGNERWCPYCASQKLCEKKDCQSCHEKSFVSHEKSKYWSSKNTIKPRNITKSSGKSYYFNCENGHEFLQRIHCLLVRLALLVSF